MYTKEIALYKEMLNYLPVDTLFIEDYIKAAGQIIIPVSKDKEMRIGLGRQAGVRMRPSGSDKRIWELRLSSREENPWWRARDFSIQLYQFYLYFKEGLSLNGVDFKEDIERLEEDEVNLIYAFQDVTRDEDKRTLLPFAIETIDRVEALIEKKENTKHQFVFEAAGRRLSFDLDLVYESASYGSYRIYLSFYYQDGGGKEREINFYGTNAFDNGLNVAEKLVEAVISVCWDYDEESSMYLARKLINAVE